MQRSRHVTLSILISLWINPNVRAQTVGLGAPPSSRTDGALQGVRGGVPGGQVAPMDPRAILPAGVRETAPGVFNIIDPRPLEKAMHLLSRKLGIPISYEEPAWVGKGDVIPAAEYPGNEKMAYPGPLIPRGGNFDVVIPRGVISDPTGIIQAAVESHRRFHNPGEFKVITFGEGEFAVVPDRAEDKNGKMEQQVSPFDSRISFPEEERTFSATFKTVFEAIRAAGQAHISMGFFPNDTLYPRFRLGARNEVARDVLARMLRKPGGQKFSWWLRYDPQGKAYVFNLVSVQAETQIPGGGVGLQYVVWPKAQSR